VAADLVERQTLEKPLAARYAGWSSKLGASIVAGGASLEDLERQVAAGGIDPKPVSGGQERLEGQVNRRIWGVDSKQ
jgi:xylose isomerase